MLNRVMIIGRLGKDPELRNGVTKFSVATDESYTDRNGVRQNVTEWHNIVTFGKTAENCSQYLSKGSLVYVDGKLRTRKWQDQSGQDRYSTEVNADRVQFLDRKDSAQPAQERAVTSRPQRQTPPVQQQFSTMEDDGGLPF